MIRRRLDAWLLLDKPSGITSNAALQRAKRLY
ncbi:MAG: tRNA pseudouridine(55) synthase TruB, partial [Betaproteobacteria bacterium]